MFGAAVCVTEKRHIAIDILPLALSRAGKRMLFLGIYISMFLVSLYMIYYGRNFAAANMRQVIPALQIPFGRVYTIIPISSVFVCINIVRVAILDWTVTYAPQSVAKFVAKEKEAAQ
jgi:TRAP-type C4-dicarboxylate transport system permease small subunit